ncbi:hypothetical protein V8E36_004240 [Tilletia maclaganii]
MWNKTEKFLKFHPAERSTWESANPTLAAAASASHASRHAKYYDHLSPTNTAEIESWWPIYLTTADHHERSLSFNEAYRTLVKMMHDLEDDYGVCSFAVVAHPSSGIRASIASTPHLEDVFNGVVQSINVMETYSTFAMLFGSAARSNQSPAWKRAVAALNERQRDAAASGTTVTPLQTPLKPSKKLSSLLLAWVDSNLKASSAEEYSRWRKDTRENKKMSYKGLFDRFRTAGLEVRGWPIPASALLDESDIIMAKIGTGKDAAISIQGGSMYDTASWNKSHVDALSAALEGGQLTVARASVSPTGPSV